MNGNTGITIIDIIILVVFLYFIIRGYEQGFIDQTCKIFGLILAILMGIQHYDSFVVFLEPYLNLPPSLMYIISFALIFIAVNLVVLVLGRVFKQIVQFLFLGLLDSVAGALFGFLKGGVIVYLLLLILNQIPYQALVSMLEQSILASSFLQITPVIQQNLGDIFGHN